MTYAIGDIREVLVPVKRWTEWRKTLLIAAIAQNVMTEAAACKLHNISVEELNRWRELQKQRKSLRALDTQKVRR